MEGEACLTVEPQEILLEAEAAVKAREEALNQELGRSQHHHYVIKPNSLSDCLQM